MSGESFDTYLSPAPSERQLKRRRTSPEQKSSERNTVKLIAKQALYGVVTLGVSATSYAGVSYGNQIVAMNTFTASNDAMSAIASEILDQDTRVDCNNAALNSTPATVGGYRLGQVANHSLPFVGRFSFPVMTLRESLCETVINYDSALPDPIAQPLEYEAYDYDTTAYAQYVGIVLHEGEHIKGTVDEAVANCHAFQKLPQALSDLGFTDADADHYAHQAVDQMSNSMDKRYYSDECRAGGNLDLGVSDIFLTHNPVNQFS